MPPVIEECSNCHIGIRLGDSYTMIVLAKMEGDLRIPPYVDNDGVFCAACGSKLDVVEPKDGK